MNDRQYQTVLRTVFGGDEAELQRRTIETLEATIEQMKTNAATQQELIDTQRTALEVKQQILVGFAGMLRTVGRIVTLPPALVERIESIEKEK